MKRSRKLKRPERLENTKHISKEYLRQPPAGFRGLLPVDVAVTDAACAALRRASRWREARLFVWAQAREVRGSLAAKWDTVVFTGDAFYIFGEASYYWTFHSHAAHSQFELQCAIPQYISSSSILTKTQSTNE